MKQVLSEAAHRPKIGLARQCQRKALDDRERYIQTTSTMNHTKLAFYVYFYNFLLLLLELFCAFIQFYSFTYYSIDVYSSFRVKLQTHAIKAEKFSQLFSWQLHEIKEFSFVNFVHHKSIEHSRKMLFLLKNFVSRSSRSDCSVRLKSHIHNLVINQ